MKYLIDSILMRLWLIWVALTKRYFICCGYNKKRMNEETKGPFAFSHLPKDEKVREHTINALRSFADYLEKESNSFNYLK